MKETNNFFPKNLQYLRKERHLTQTELANKINVDQTTIGRWEDGNREPTVGNVSNIADVFNITITDLLDKDLSQENNSYDELELLYSKYKDVIPDSDKETIRFVIEKNIKKIDEQLGDDK